MTFKSVTALLLACAAVALCPDSASAQLRISHVGKGAVSNFSAYNGQFVELFNAGNAPVSLSGKSIQWSSSPAGGSWTKFDLAGTIAPSGYWLVRLTATSTFDPAAGAGIPFDADQTMIGFNGTYLSLITIGDSGGKVVLADTTSLFTTNGCAAPDAAHVLDLVSWDDVPSTAPCHEGSACALIPFPGNFAGGIGSTAALRKCGGTQDTNDNFNDFVTTARAPRNSSYTGHIDAPAVSSKTQVTGQDGRGISTGYAGQTALFTSGPSTCTGTITGVSIDLSPVGGSATQPMLDNGSQGDAVAGDGIYSFLYTIPPPPSAPLGIYNLTITATDSLALTGTGAARLTVAPTPPANDLCVSAQVIAPTTLPVFVSALGNLVSAGPVTKVMTGCTSNGGNGGTSRDVWFSFTPIDGAFYTISTCNAVTAPGLFTSVNTVIGIHATCPDESALDLSGLDLACNDQGCTNFIGGGPSTIPFFLMDAGTTYYIRVACFGSGTSIAGAPFRLDITSEPFGACCFPNGTCNTMLQVSCDTQGGTFRGEGTTCSTVTCPAPPPPTNNECAAAVALTVGLDAPGTSYGASGTDLTVCDETTWDVWYTFAPPSDGDYRLTVTRTSGSQVPGISLFSVCPPVANTSIACIAPPFVGATKTLSFSATTAAPLLVRIATNFSQRSDFTVRVDPVTPPCSIDFNNDGVVSPDDLDEFITTYFSEPPDNAPADFNNDGIVSPDDLDEFITAYFEGC